MKLNKKALFAIGTAVVLLLVGVIAYSLVQRSNVGPEESSAARIPSPPVCGQSCTSDAFCRGANRCGVRSFCAAATSGGSRRCVPGAACYQKSCQIDRDCLLVCGQTGVCRPTSGAGNKCFYRTEAGALVNDMYEATE